MKTAKETTAAAKQPVTKRRVFLVDDHPITRAGVTVLINQQTDLEVCGEADSAPKALELIGKLQPDVAVIDITLKTTSGIELLKNIASVLPRLPLLVMSMHDESL